MTDWRLDERLANDCATIGDFPLCRVLLMLDARFPWLILVPRRIRARELHHLSREDRAALMEECAAGSDALQQISECEKLNVAALGNVVPQLHIHVIARFANDAAWPRPVWNVGTAAPYSPTSQAEIMERLKAALDL